MPSTPTTMSRAIRAGRPDSALHSLANDETPKETRAEYRTPAATLLAHGRRAVRTRLLMPETVGRRRDRRHRRKSEVRAPVGYFSTTVRRAARTSQFAAPPYVRIIIDQTA
jgi:hypothetical protein